ncbi:unnamed protein product, partial [Rotaria magnacalcarata]
MSVASLNLYHRGKHHLHPVPKWIGRLFFIIIPKLLFMNIDLPVQLQNQSESFLKCMTTKTSVTSEKSETRKKLTHKSDTKNKNALLHNGKITLYEDPVDRNTTSSLTFSDKLNSYDFYTSPPLILRSYPPIQTSNTLSNRQSHKPHDKDNQNCLTDLTNKNTNATKLSMDYIHRLVEQNESRYEQQEHNRSIGQEWQILGRVVDRLLVFIFLITTM